MQAGPYVLRGAEDLREEVPASPLHPEWSCQGDQGNYSLTGARCLASKRGV